MSGQIAKGGRGKGKVIRALACAAFTFTFTFTSAATVVRPAPSFTFTGIGGVKKLSNLRGQPVVLLVAKDAKSRAFRKQVKAIEAIYREFASRGTVFVAAFADGAEPASVPSNVPFVLAHDGPGIAAAYALREDTVLAVIGRDGNLDLLTSKPVTGARLREVIQNSYQVQSSARREVPQMPKN